MGVSNYALDTFVAQDMSKLMQWSIKSLAEAFPSADKWLTQFVLRSIFQTPVTNEKAALAFAIILRTHAVLQEWESASAAAQGNLRSVGMYFSVIGQLENCISSAWKGFELARKSVGQDFFKKGAGSVYERLNRAYNVCRHFDPQALSAGDLHRVCLSDETIHTLEQMIRFDELREAIPTLAGVSAKVAGA